MEIPDYRLATIQRDLYARFRLWERFHGDGKKDCAFDVDTQLYGMWDVLSTLLGTGHPVTLIAYELHRIAFNSQTWSIS